MHFFQATFFTGCTISEAFFVRDDRQIAINVISPCVIGAAKVNSMAAFLGDQPVAAMLANIVEPLDFFL